MAEPVSCPQCGRKLLVPESYGGEAVECPSCQARFLAGPLLPIGEAVAIVPGQAPSPAYADRAKEGVRAAGGVPLEFISISVSDARCGTRCRYERTHLNVRQLRQSSPNSLVRLCYSVAHKGS